MSIVQLFVHARADAWFVSLAGAEYGPFGSEATAVDRAIDAGESCVGDGLAARIIVEGRLGGFRTVWLKEPEAETVAIAA